MAVGKAEMEVVGEVEWWSEKGSKGPLNGRGLHRRSTLRGRRGSANFSLSLRVSSVKGAMAILIISPFTTGLRLSPAEAIAFSMAASKDLSQGETTSNEGSGACTEATSNIFIIEP